MVKVHPTPLSFRRIRLLTTFYLKIFITPHFNLIQKKKILKRGKLQVEVKNRAKRKKNTIIKTIEKR